MLIRDPFYFSDKVEKSLTSKPNPIFLENVKSFWPAVTGSMIERKTGFTSLPIFHFYLVKVKEDMILNV